MHPTKIIINKNQFIKNLETIKAKVGEKTKLCLPVKANAYGHGLVQTALIAESHVDYLAVACLDEGVTLVKNGIKKPILVFGSFDDQQISELIANKLEITVTSLEKAKALSEYCRQIETICQVHIKIDTGMHRVGALDDEAKELIDYVANNPVLEFIGIYSHLAASDSPNRIITEMQIEKFTKIAEYAKSLKSNIICHLANSGGVTYYPESYFDMVRPGILSYGYYVHKDMAESLITVKPCLSLISRIMHLKTVAENTGISYGHRYTTQETSNIATIQIGYGDGYRRSLSNKGQLAIINGMKFPIVGNICMDMLMINLGNYQGAKVGDEVVLVGSQGNETIELHELSEKLQTIDYEVLVGFTGRIPRVFV